MNNEGSPLTHVSLISPIFFDKSIKQFLEEYAMLTPNIKRHVVMMLLLVCPIQLTEAAKGIEEISSCIEHFSRWKTTVEAVITEAKSRKLSEKEIRALKFLYKPVRADVNAIIDRTIFDFEQRQAISEERYRDSIMKAQESVNRFREEAQRILQPPSESEFESQPMAGKYIIDFVKFLIGATSFLDNILGIISYFENSYNKHEEEKRKDIIERLRNLKLQTFDDIS